MCYFAFRFYFISTCFVVFCVLAGCNSKAKQHKNQQQGRVIQQMFEKKRKEEVERKIFIDDDKTVLYMP